MKEIVLLIDNVLPRFGETFNHKGKKVQTLTKVKNLVKPANKKYQYPMIDNNSIRYLISDADNHYGKISLVIQLLKDVYYVDIYLLINELTENEFLNLSIGKMAIHLTKLIINEITDETINKLLVDALRLSRHTTVYHYSVYQSIDRILELGQQFSYLNNERSFIDIRDVSKWLLNEFHKQDPDRFKYLHKALQ